MRGAKIDEINEKEEGKEKERQNERQKERGG